MRAARARGVAAVKLVELRVGSPDRVAPGEPAVRVETMPAPPATQPVAKTPAPNFVRTRTDENFFPVLQQRFSFLDFFTGKFEGAVATLLSPCIFRET